jgi:DNA-directed RNA polymerase subunit RPC12/RpoP
MAHGAIFPLSYTFRHGAADRTNMECPGCRSTLLMIRRNTGLERLRTAFTGMRRYRCRECEHQFRAVDRRSVPRSTQEAAGARKSLA